MSNQDGNTVTSNVAWQQQGEDVAHSINGYIPAPYYAYKRNRTPGCYIVLFTLGHTLEKHFVFIGIEFEVKFAFEDWYTTNLSDQSVTAIRLDPGVALVEEDMTGKRN